MVSHSMEDVANYATRIAVLEHGALALLGEPLLSRLRTQTERLVYGIYRGSYRIETAKLQEDAVPLGVLRLLAEETEALQ